MNRIVDSWNRHEQKPKHNGPDSVTIDGETLILPNIEGEKLEVKKMAHPDRKISISEEVVKEMALHGPQNEVEMLFRETHRTLKRLKEVAGTRVKVFRRMNRNIGGRPNLHDMMSWLDNLEVVDKFKDEIVFLKRLHITLRSRVHLSVIKQIEG